MNYYQGAIIIIGMCVVTLGVVFLKRRAELFLNFLLRGIIGCLAIFAINEILISQQIQTFVGINPCTVLTSGFLGLPGVALLYGVHFLKFL